MPGTHYDRLVQMAKGAIPRPAAATPADTQQELRMLEREISTLLRGRRALKERLAAMLCLFCVLATGCSPAVRVARHYRHFTHEYHRQQRKPK